MASTNNILEQSFLNFIDEKAFPCSGAKTALARDQITFYLADSIHCPARDVEILKRVYQFIEQYRLKGSLFSSLIIAFNDSQSLTEVEFETALWKRLQALHKLDLVWFEWNKTVSAEPTDKNFSFSLGGEAFYLIGGHPNSGRPARAFQKPAIVFNLHEQFEQLRQAGKYTPMRDSIRAKDARVNGSVNPMLSDFGTQSEARQYSGRSVDPEWKCPFHQAS